MTGGGLDKEQYLETQKLLKAQHEDLKVYLRETFVCIPDCGKHRGKIDKDIAIINNTSEVKSTSRKVGLELLRMVVMIAAFFGLNKIF